MAIVLPKAKRQYAKKYRRKGTKDWSYMYFWAVNDKDAIRVFKEQINGPSLEPINMEYHLVKQK
jgi:hypothetical protein